MPEEGIAGYLVPSGIPRDFPPVTPDDDVDNMPSNAIGFIIYWPASLNVQSDYGEISVVTATDETRTIPFINRHLHYAGLNRIRAEGFPTGAIALAATT